MSGRVASTTESTLIDDALAGNRRALAGLISVVERGGEPARSLAPRLHVTAPHAFTLGLTGAPGAGKSTLTDGLIGRARAGGASIAVVAVDPSSPFTGGAILGDRVRLREEHVADDAVYVRSLANRGHLGGLAQAVPAVVRVLDRTGWDWVIVETVGVGQAEVGIASQADTTLVVVNPGWGDEVQANKAGLLEVADILVVNKAERDGAAEAVRNLRGMLALAPKRDWTPPIVKTSALSGEGVDDLWLAIERHRAHLEASGELDRRRAERRLDELRQRVSHEVERAARLAEQSPELSALLQSVANGDTDPTTAAAKVVAVAARRLRKA
jgi:LAO/AO transport system kinase